MSRGPRFLDEPPVPGSMPVIDTTTPGPAVQTPTPGPAINPSAPGSATHAASSGPAIDTSPARPALLEPSAETPSSLAPHWEPPPLAPARPRAGNASWVAAGIAVALVSWAGVTAMSWLSALISQPTPLGIAGAIGVGLGLALAGWGVTGEWRDYRRLRVVDTLRQTLSDPHAPLEAQRAAARLWLAAVAPALPDAARIDDALRAAGSGAEVVAILRAQVAARLRAATSRIGQDAAIEGAALVAISPHASWDALIAAWKGLVVIRKVARLHGLRPGPAVTAALLRKVAWTAAGTAGVDLLSQTLADQALSSLPVARHVLAAVPGGGVAALRLYRLATITGAACSPVPRADRKG